MPVLSSVATLALVATLSRGRLPRHEVPLQAIKVGFVLVFLAASALWVPTALAQAPEVAWATARQETFPAWSARQQAAAEQLRAREAWFSGEESFALAFPHLNGAALNEDVVLRGQLAMLDQAAVARAAERLVPAPDLGNAARAPQWVENRESALRAEDAAEALERRLLVQSAAISKRYPSLSKASVDRVKAPLLRRIRRAAALAEDDPARPEAVLAAARAEFQIRRLDDAVWSIRGVLLRPGIGTLSASGELERLASNGLGPAINMALMLPVLSPSERIVIERELLAWWTAAVETEVATPIEDGLSLSAMAERLVHLGAIHAEQEVALAALDDPRSPMEEARKATREAWVASALRALEAGEKLVLETRGQAFAAADVAREEQEAAVLASEQAAAAEASASDRASRTRARFLSLRADAQLRAAALAKERESAALTAGERRDAVEQSIEGIESDIDAIVEAGPGDRPPDPNEVYQSLRAFSSAHRTGDITRGASVVAAKARWAATEREVSADHRRLVEARAFAVDRPDDVGLNTALDAWEGGLQVELEVAQSLVDLMNTDRDVVLKGLQRAREARRRLRPMVSREQRHADREIAARVALDEVALFGPSVIMQARDRLDAALQMPSRLLDFNILAGIVSGSFWTLLILALWFWARGQADAWALQAANRVRRVRPELRPTDLKALRDPVARFLRNFVDLFLGGSLALIGNLMPELGFFLHIYLWVALYRVLLAAFDLMVVPADEVRPALTVVRRDVWGLARTTVRVALAFFIARAFTHYLLWEVFRFDIVDSIARFLFNVVGLIGVACFLFVWEPTLRAWISRRNQSNAFIAFLARDGHPGLRIVRAATTLGFYGFVVIVDLGNRFTREGSQLTRLTNAVSRYRLQREDDSPRRSLPADRVEAIVSMRTPDNQVLERPEVTPVVASAVSSWQTEGRGGLLALVGGRGSGKKTACNSVLEHFREASLEVISVHLTERLITEEDMITWLCEVTGVGPQDTVEALVLALEALEPHAYVLQEMHRAYGRRVGGFGAISTLFYVSNATSGRHFWVVSMHEPTWDFFSSSGSVVDLSVFKTVVTLAPMDAAQLQNLTTARTRRAGFEVDFSDLASANPLGGDPEIELERAINLFYRLLIEASEGNPTVALYLWTQCLEPQGDGATVKVYLGRALQVGVLDDLVDNALFALVALHVQDELTQRELVEVTNLSPRAVRTTVRDLVMRGLVHLEGDRYRILHRYIPAIARTLRRRHILHLGAS